MNRQTLVRDLHAHNIKFQRLEFQRLGDSWRATVYPLNPDREPFVFTKRDYINKTFDVLFLAVS